MTNFIPYLLASSYSGLSPLINTASAVCTSNGQVVECPAWLPAFSASFFAVMAAFMVLMVASMWKVFTKAGQPGWASIVPIYSYIVLLDIVRRPRWWVILIFIPFVNVVIGVMVYYQLAKAFGKDMGYAIGLILLPIIFFPMLAYGKSVYIPAAPAAPAAALV